MVVKLTDENICTDCSLDEDLLFNINDKRIAPGGIEVKYTRAYKVTITSDKKMRIKVPAAHQGIREERWINRCRLLLEQFKDIEFPNTIRGKIANETRIDKGFSLFTGYGGTKRPRKYKYKFTEDNKLNEIKGE